MACAKVICVNEALQGYYCFTLIAIKRGWFPIGKLVIGIKFMVDFLKVVVSLWLSNNWALFSACFYCESFVYQPQRSMASLQHDYKKSPRFRGNVHWNDPHHPAHWRIGRYQGCRSAVLHEFQLALHRLPKPTGVFPTCCGEWWWQGSE